MNESLWATYWTGMFLGGIIWGGITLGCGGVWRDKRERARHHSVTQEEVRKEARVFLGVLFLGPFVLALWPLLISLAVIFLIGFSLYRLVYGAFDVVKDAW